MTEAAASSETSSPSAGSAWDSLVPPAVDDEVEAPKESYQDPAVESAAGAMLDVPQWLGSRWRDLPQESMPEVWRWLRGWVDWVVEAHMIPVDEIPPCWFRHQEIVEELWAAANAEAQAWEATTPTMVPMTAWHFHLRIMRDRLSGRAKECVGSGKHVAPHSFRRGWGPGVLAVDEADWAAHLGEVVDTQPASVDHEAATVLWRMCATDGDGEVIASDAVDVGPVEKQGPVTISGPVRRGGDSDGGVLLGATVSAGAGEITRTWWESSADGGVSWDKAVTSEVDRTEDAAEDEEAADQGRDEA